MLRSATARIAAVVVMVVLAFACAGAGSSYAKSKKSDSSKSVKKDKKDKGKKEKGTKDKGKKDKGKKDKNGAKSRKDKKSKTDKKSSKKDRSDKKSGKKEPIAAKKTARSTQAPVETSSRRGKNEDSRAASYTASNSVSPSSVKRQPEPTYVSNGDNGGSGDNGEDADEPDLPKPANRVVADIASSRVTQIQSALIKQGLLAGPPSGVYDQATFSAMATFQTRNGWNPVGVPTASSLKALGVPKNSGRNYPTPGRVVDETAPTP